MTIRTPWGTPDDEIVYAEDVTFYRLKDERRFKKEHAGDWLAISVIRSDRHPRMIECVATRGGACPAIAELRYLVLENEYAKSGRFGFVIDEARHENQSDQ